MNVKKERKKREFTLNDMAEVAGVTSRTVWNWENKGISEKAKIYLTVKLAQYDADRNTVA